MEKYLQLLKENGATLAQVVRAESVVTAPWVRYRCQFGCAQYGEYHCCPPATPDWRETRAILDCFQYGILFRCATLTEVTPLAVKISRELFLDDYYRTVAFGAGNCHHCKKCNPTHCQFPRETVPSMEACSMDVFATVRNNGIEIHAVKTREDEAQYFGLIMVE